MRGIHYGSHYEIFTITAVFRVRYFNFNVLKIKMYGMTLTDSGQGAIAGFSEHGA
jgi:hypothetical protein